MTVLAADPSPGVAVSTRLDGGASVGELDALLDREAARSLFDGAGLDVRCVEPTYLRLKPGHSALVGCTIRGEGPEGEVSVEAYARTFEGDDAAAIAAKWPSERAVDTPLGPGVVLVPGGRTVVFQFPNDGALRRLPSVVDPARVRRMLDGLPDLDGFRVQSRRSAVRPVRWKPERRLVAAGDLRLAGDDGERRSVQVHMRWFPDARASWLAETARHLSAHGVRVPGQLGSAAAGHLHVESSLEGRDGAEALLAGELRSDAVLDLVATLHAAPPVRSSSMVTRTTRRSALAALELLALADASMQETCAAAARSPLGPADGVAPTLLHGDLHLHQLLAGPAGLGLVDLERAGVGDPLVDVSSLLAHVLDLAGRHPDQRAQLDAFAASVAEGVLRTAPARTASLVALLRAALIERALLSLRQLEPDWRGHAHRLLRRALGEDDGAVWDVLHPRPSGTWTGWRADGSGVVPGSFEPVTGAFVACRPDEDPALPGLRPWAEGGELLSHRPGRRAVVRVDGSDAPIYVKVVRPRRTDDLVARHRRMDELRARHPTAVPSTPAVLGADRRTGVVVLEEVAGAPLHDLLVAGDADERRRGLERVGAALADLARVDAAHLGLGPAADGGDLTAWRDLVATHHPAAVTPYQRVHHLLGSAPAPPAARRLVHGDLHDRNVLLGGQIGWIDLDGLGVGDPAIDLGNLAAHVVLRAIQRGDGPAIGSSEAEVLLDAAGAGESARRWTARTLFRLSCLYRFRRRWAPATPVLLAQAEHWAGTSPLPDERPPR